MADNAEGKKSKYLWFLILHGLVFFLSLSGVLSKLASGQPFLSLPFIGLYAAEIFVLFVYAILWQQVLKHMPLTVAFSNKAVGTVWSMLWGYFLFNEVITVQMIIGAVIVLAGVLVVVTSDE